MEDDPDDTTPERPDSLLPYDVWTEEALRHVVVQALAYVAAEGMPGEHHFYITFRTDQPGVEIPARLLAKHAQDMTIVLQHQFWDLTVDEEAESFSVGLKFGGVPATVRVPFAAMTAFADPYVQFGLRFRAEGETAANDGSRDLVPMPEPAPEPAAEPQAAEPESQVVSLDAFRRRGPSKE